MGVERCQRRNTPWRFHDTAARDGWRIGDPLATHPGDRTHRGAALRALILDPLRDAADAHHVTIHAVAATQKLADQYMTELPGLVDVGPYFPRGRKPRSAPA